MARRIFYVTLFLCSIWICGMGYRQVTAAHPETMPDPAAWLPKQEVTRLMKYHGTDGMMVTQDAAYILRDSKWILVMKRI